MPVHLYQLYGVNAIANRRRSRFRTILIADGPGLGKTAQAIGDIVNNIGKGGGPALVIVA